MDKIARPNFELAANEPDNERHLANAILTLDACAGLFHRDLLDLNNSSTPARDEDFRQQLAQENGDYHVLRDVAAAYKHGELVGKRPRLVISASQISEMENVIGFFQCGDELGGNILVIETIDGKETRATDPLFGTMRMLLAKIAKLKEEMGRL